MNLIEHMLFAPRGGTFQEVHGISVFLEPRDDSLYQKLLPPPLTVPVQPIAMIYVGELVRVAPWPLTPYGEWSFFLKCGLKGEEGWFSVTMPVTKWVAMAGGRYLGFPKYLADEIRLKHDGNAVVGWGKHKGVTELELEFLSGVTRTLTDWERRLIDDPPLIKTPLFQLVPPGKGPRVLKITFGNTVEPKYSPCPGMVKVHANPSESWAGLIPANSIFPGTTNHFSGGIDLVWTEA